MREKRCSGLGSCLPANIVQRQPGHLEGGAVGLVPRRAGLRGEQSCQRLRRGAVAYDLAKRCVPTNTAPEVARHASLAEAAQEERGDTRSGSAPDGPERRLKFVIWSHAPNDLEDDLS